MSDFLRIEGINFSSFVLDTADLSTIRGGGLLLLQAIERIEAQFVSRMTLISKGASVGLFEIVAGESGSAVRDDVESFVRDDSQLKHGTFAVDFIIGRSKGFKKTRESLLAKNRFRQMCSPSIAFPSQEKKALPCSEDRLRPAAPSFGVSKSVHIRREHGRSQKQRFYERATGLQGLPPFSNDLGELALAQDRGNLNGKMAVIYVDGNGFGTLQEKLGSSPKDLRDFDARLRGRRANLLRDLLKEAMGRPGFMNDELLRFETLLWGGDEMAWVVPAWEGWWTLGTFFEKARVWKEMLDGKEKALTHSGGIVFCHHKAPIERVRHLAKALAEHAKCDRERNLVCYAVLESFDHAGTDLAGYLKARCPSGVATEDVVLPGDEMLAVLKDAAKVKASFPKKALFDEVRGLLGRGGERGKAVEAMNALDDQTRQALLRVRSSFSPGLSRLAGTEDGGPPADISWVHLLELWDYLGKEEV